MGLWETSSFSIFTFINASNLKFCKRSCSSCVYHMMRFEWKSDIVLYDSNLEKCEKYNIYTLPHFQ